MSQKTLKKLEILFLDKNGSFLDSQLRIAGLYLIAFEMLKDSMRHIIISLNSCPEIHNGKVVNITSDGVPIEEADRYQKLLKGKKSYQNQVRYLLENSIITKDDSELLLEWLTPNFRNDVAHRLIKHLIDDTQPVLDLLYVKCLSAIIFRIENWWIKNIEAAIDPETYEQYPPDSLDTAASMAWHILQTLVARVEKTIPSV